MHFKNNPLDGIVTFPAENDICLDNPLDGVVTFPAKNDPPQDPFRHMADVVINGKLLKQEPSSKTSLLASYLTHTI